MGDLGAPRGKLPFKELSWLGLLAAAELGWWPRAGDVRAKGGQASDTQVTAEEMLQPGLESSSVLHTGIGNALF